MPTLNYYLKHRDKTEEKTIFLRYRDKTKSAGKKIDFTEHLPYKVHPDKWQHRIDSKTKREYWLAEETQQDIELNKFLRYRKASTLDLLDRLTNIDKQGNKTFPTVEEVENLYKKEISKQGDSNPKELPVISSPNHQSIAGEDKHKPTISELIYKYIDDKAGEITKGTEDIFDVLARVHISSFQEQEKTLISIDQLDKECFKRFKDFLTAQEEGRNMLNSTAKKYLRKVKDVMNFYKSKYPDMHLGFLDGKYPRTKDQIFFALYEELNKLKTVDYKKIILDQYKERFTGAAQNGESYWTTRQLSILMQVGEQQIRRFIKEQELPYIFGNGEVGENYLYPKSAVLKWISDKQWSDEKQHLESKVQALTLARDLYCYASEAPARYSDLIRLNYHSHLFEDIDDKGRIIKVLKFISQKTKVETYIPLNEYCLHLHEKWREYSKEQGNLLLPVPKYNSDLNKNLHRALELSGLFDENTVIYQCRSEEIIEKNEARHQALTFHSSRHNYGTNMAANQANIKHIQLALGHKKIDSTQIYIDVIKSKFYSSTLNKFRKKQK